MATSRRPCNGRSPPVNQQRQITSFFSKSTSASPPILLSKSNPSHNRSPSPSPTTPSPIDTKHHHRNKPPLVITGPQLSPPSYAEEVLNRRIRVYWPLDKSWYEGCVKSFDKVSGKHLIQYEDAEEELLDLGKEKIEWLGGEVAFTRKFRRLRRVFVVEDEEEETPVGDDSDDEDWGTKKDVEIETAVDDILVDTDLEDEEDEVLKGKGSGTRKRKKSGEDEIGASKKSKNNIGAKKSGANHKDALYGNAVIQPTRDDGGKL